MYIEQPTSFYRGTEQCAGRARFLILVQDKSQPLGPNNMRAIVRKVALRQCGHWMMGCARIGGKTITISGSYGSDGLPVTVDTEIYNRGIDLPQDLYNAWSKGGGHNSAGSEAVAMRKWAQENFK